MKKKRLGWLLLWWKRTGEMRIYGRTTWSSLVWSPIYVCHHVFSFGIQSLMHHWFLGICPIKSIQKDWHLNASTRQVLAGSQSCWKFSSASSSAHLLPVLMLLPPGPLPYHQKNISPSPPILRFEMRFSCLELHSLPTCDNVLKYRQVLWFSFSFVRVPQ